MKTNIYALFNNLSNAYERIFEAGTDRGAQYLVSDWAKVPNSSLRHLEEIQLCKVAQIDVETGIVLPMPAPVRIGMLTESDKPIDDIEKSMTK